MALTGIIEIDGIYYVVEDGIAYYFDDTDNEDEMALTAPFTSFKHISSEL